MLKRKYELIWPDDQRSDSKGALFKVANQEAGSGAVQNLKMDQCRVFVWLKVGLDICPFGKLGSYWVKEGRISPRVLLRCRPGCSLLTATAAAAPL